MSRHCERSGSHYCSRCDNSIPYGLESENTALVMEREELNRTLDEELLRLVRVTADRDALRAEVKRLNAWFGTDKELSTVTADRDRLKADNKKLQSALKDWETDADRLQQELDETHVQLRAAVAQIRT